MADGGAATPADGLPVTGPPPADGLEAAAAAAAFGAVRADLIGLAYRMTGSLAEAEDIAQDTFLRWSGTDRGRVAAPRAWMLKTAARLSLDHLKSARHRRETYVGPWLPEPVPEDDEAPQQARLAHAQAVSVAFLLTLQRLSPAERAVFILHDLFETPFAEIAALLGRGEAACRKLASRARARLGGTAGGDAGLPAGPFSDPSSGPSSDPGLPPPARVGRVPPAAPDPAPARRIAAAFLAASRGGDVAALRDLLARDVVLHTDGGGRRRAALNPVRGAERVGRFFAGLARKHPALPPLLHLGRINALPGYVTLEADGLPQTTALELREGRIVAIYVVRNPEKLAGIIRRYAAPVTPA
ncbi:sigma-70 family RNA polymerase sigma factor [Roseomonas sp. NAR14]|uniref:Sigma-70 family RNA polymerase sigma factor n=1 Tax=Roseomonas acroporae TaxID=2937791 RepID=A0A9X1Y743_9PROT|nr:sigma-70 family RNA polymerase sigma factor [Roseomonas acroporae]MCK8785199.1 sigma-70 family RNA polymerase sigma factor [Roseomonas acroporae]